MTQHLKPVDNLRDAEQKVVKAAMAAASDIDVHAMAKAFYGEQAEDSILALLDAVRALRALTQPETTG